MPAHSKHGKTNPALMILMCLVIVALGAWLYASFSSEGRGSPALLSGGIGTPGTQVSSADVVPFQDQQAVIAANVSIAGLDTGGLAAAKARRLMEESSEALLKRVKISFTVGDKQINYTAADLGITLDAEASVTRALAYQPSGGTPGKDFDPVYAVNADKAAARIQADEATMSRAPVDAQVQFAPENRKELFKYTPETAGIAVRTDELITMICTRAAAGQFGVFQAPADPVSAKVTAEDLKKNTVPMVYAFDEEQKAWVAGFTSYFKRSNESGANRVFNIAKMAGILNGVVIEPGETFSLNERAGPRTVARGWKKAHGIVDGRYEDQPGGGVCQVSGTLYNAAIRAELEIPDRTHHSWPSTYLPKGLDATISTGGPDLKLKNPYDVPVYITAYADTKVKSLTITIYGKPRADGLYVDYTSKKIGTIAQPAAQVINANEDYDGNKIPVGGRVVYEGHTGQIWNVYKQWKDAEGNVQKTEFMYKDTYRAFQARILTNPGAPEPKPKPPDE